jgi:hypothetical protein
MGYFHKFTAYFNLIIMNKSFIALGEFIFIFSCKKEEVIFLESQMERLITSLLL